MHVPQVKGEPVAAVDLGVAVTVLPEVTATVVDTSPNHMN